MAEGCGDEQGMATVAAIGDCESTTETSETTESESESCPEQVGEMDQLPIELLYFILSKLDGAGLGCASRVCTKWRDVVGNLGRAFNIWFRVCLKEMGMDAIIAQTGMTRLASASDSKSRQNQDSVCERVQADISQWPFWRNLYIAHYRCQNMKAEGWQVDMFLVWKSSHQFFLSRNRVDTTARTMGVLPCSHLDGQGKVCVVFKGGQMRTFSLSQAGSTVSWGSRLPLGHDALSLCPMTMNGCPGFSFESSQEAECFFLSNMPFNRLLLSDHCLDRQAAFKDPADEVHCISTVGSFFAVGTSASQRQGVLVYGLKGRRRTRPREQLAGVGTTPSPPPCPMPSHAVLLRLKGCLSSDVTALALGHNQAVAGDDMGLLYHWTYPPLTLLDQLDSRGSVGSVKVGGVVEAKVHQMDYGIARLLLHQGCVIALTNRGQSDLYVIDVSDWTRVQRIRDVTLRSLAYNNASFVTCIESCSALLAIGFSSGEIMVFNTADPLWTLDLSSHIVWRCRACVSRFSTMAFTHGPSGPTLVVGGDAIKVLQWKQVRGTRREREIKKKDKEEPRKRRVVNSCEPSMPHVFPHFAETVALPVPGEDPTTGRQQPALNNNRRPPHHHHHHAAVVDLLNNFS